MAGAVQYLLESRLTFMNWLWDRHGTWNPTRACSVVSLRAVSLTQLCKFDCAKEVLVESAILWTKGLTAPPPSGLYRVLLCWGAAGPRPPQREVIWTMLEFGTKWLTYRIPSFIAVWWCCCIVETTNIVSSLAVAKEFWGRNHLYLKYRFFFL